MARVPKRSSTIPAPDWWIQAAATMKRDRGLINAQITERVRVSMGLAKLDESRVSMCLTGDTAPVPLLREISRVLGIPSCVFLPSSMAEARQLAAVSAEVADADRLAMLDAEIDDEEDDAASLKRSGRQTKAVGSADVGRTRQRPGGGVGDRRRGAGQA